MVAVAVAADSIDVLCGGAVNYLCVLVCRLSGKELLELQSKVEDAECLPTLSVNDIERHTERDPFVVQHKGSSSFFFFFQSSVLSGRFMTVSSSTHSGSSFPLPSPRRSC